jgi:hypothetical protein
MSPFIASKELRIKLHLIDLMVIAMKGLPSGMFWNVPSIYTGNFIYPSSFGY